jgi:cytochrome P450
LRKPFQPAFLNYFESLQLFGSYIVDPLVAVRQIYEKHGPYVVGMWPVRRNGRPAKAIIAVGSEINREVLNKIDVWRTASISGPFTFSRRNAARRRGNPDHPACRLHKGIIAMQGKRHAHYRKLTLPPLKRSRIEGFGDGLIQMMADQVESWPSGAVFDLWGAVQTLMQRTAVDFLFGSDRERGCPMAKMVSESGVASFSKRVNIFPLDIPGTPFYEEMARSEEMERLVTTWATHKRGEKDENDLFSMLVNHPDENGNTPQDRHLLDHIPTLLGAAFETCQNVVIWSLVLLEQHPEVSKQLLAEIREALTGKTLDVKTLDQLPYLDAVVKESMRLVPPVPQQFRVAMQDTTLCGHPVSRGTRILLSAYLNNRNSKIYPMPNQFLPERWATITPNPYEYSVFSAGPRSCPGYWFGMAAVKAALTTIMARYRVDLSPTPRIDFILRIALSPKRPVRALLHDQDGQFNATPLKGRFAGFFDRGC